MWYKSIAGRFFGLVTNTRVTEGLTDGQTDGQNYDSKDRASIAASCGKKLPEYFMTQLPDEYSGIP